MLFQRATLSGVAIVTAVFAVACTYDFDRFENASPASSGGTATAGSSGSGGNGNVGAGARGGSGGRGGESGENSGGGLGEAGGPETGEGGGAGFSCDELDGVVHDEHCYFVLAPGSGLSWTMARETCEGYSPSSHLVTISSSAEQAAIENALSPSVSDYWIGLALADVENEPNDDCDEAPESCPFEWVTGEALSYANWAAHGKNDVEPNYTGACVRLQLDDFNWADFDCGTRLPAVCEHDG
jgi:hypothetical protein